jgi:hypothetical protein
MRTIIGSILNKIHLIKIDFGFESIITGMERCLFRFAYFFNIIIMNDGNGSKISISFVEVYIPFLFD